MLTAQLVARGAMRSTPAGIPVYDLSLRHESTLTEDGQPRKVSFEIAARAVGAVTARIAGVEIGSTLGLAGFLGARRNGRGIVFHITEVG